MSVQRLMEPPKPIRPCPQLNGGRRLVQPPTQQIWITPNNAIHNVCVFLWIFLLLAQTMIHNTLGNSRSGLVEWALSTKLEVFRTEQLRSLKPKLLARLEEER